MNCPKWVFCFMLLVLSGVQCSSDNYYKVLDVDENAELHEIKQGYRRQSKLHHPDKSRDANATETFETINEAYQTLVDPIKRQAYDWKLKGTERAKQQMFDIVVTLDLKDFLDGIQYSWNESAPVSTCTILRGLNALPGQVLQYLFARNSTFWNEYRESTTHWLDGYICSSPPDVTPGSVVFFFAMMIPAVMLRPRWYMLCAVAYCLCAASVVAALGGKSADLEFDDLATGLAAGLHVASAVGLVMVPLFLLALVVHLAAGVLFTLEAAIGVLVFGYPSFWVFGFAPTFFLTRLAMWNAYMMVPGVLFLALSGYYKVVIQAYVIRIMRPVVLAGVFVWMMAKAVWVGAPSDVFPHFKWLWRFHALVWSVAWWAPSWLLGVALYSLQLGWSCMALALLAHCFDVAYVSALRGPQLLYRSFVWAGWYGSLTLGVGALAIKGYKALMAWREVKANERAEKLKMIEELGYEPLSARDLQKNPKLLQQQFQQRVAARAAAKKKK